MRKSRFMEEQIIGITTTRSKRCSQKTSNAQITESSCGLGDPRERLFAAESLRFGGPGTEDVPVHLDAA